MKNIGRYINELLHWHDCVIIPGLGGLVANPVSAMVDEEKLMFFPPRKEVGFNRSLSHNDGLLINHVALKEGIDYQAAKQMVGDYVAEIRERMNGGVSFNIDDVGTLKSDSIGNIIFIPDNNCGFMTDSFGLHSFHFEPLADSENSKSDKAAIRRVLKPLSFRHIAAAVAVLAGLFLFSPNTNMNMSGGVMNQAGYIDFAIPAPVSSSAAAETNVTPLDETTKAEELTAAPAEPPAEIEKKYFLIAGSFPNDKLADQFVLQLEKKGFDQTVKLHANGKVRVAIEGFATKEEAVEKMKEYKMKQGFADVWVFANRK